MNKEKKSGWYYDDTIKVALGFLGLFICYCIGVSVFISKGDDKLVGAFEAITGLSGLVLSFGTVFFVVKTYSAQKEQIRIQNIQIDIQKQEIEENKKDLEFNRALDIVYRQLEHTNSKFTYINEPSHKVLNSLYNRKVLFKNILPVKTFLNDYKSEIALYITIIGLERLTSSQKIQLGAIFNLNTSFQLSTIYNDIYNIINDEKEDIQGYFNGYILEKYVLDECFNFDGWSEQKKREHTIEKFNKELNEEFDTFKNLYDITYLIKRYLDFLAGEKYDIYI